MEWFPVSGGKVIVVHVYEGSGQRSKGNAPLVVVLDHTTNRGTVVYREQA